MSSFLGFRLEYISNKNEICPAGGRRQAGVKKRVGAAGAGGRGRKRLQSHAGHLNGVCLKEAGEDFYIKKRRRRIHVEIVEIPKFIRIQVYRYIDRPS